jgi:acylaminoacyl-peptidase
MLSSSDWYRALNALPTCTAGFVIPTAQDDGAQVLLLTKQRTVAEAARCGGAGGDSDTCMSSLVTTDGTTLLPQPFSLPTPGVKCALPSPSGRRLAVVREVAGADGGTELVLEVRDSQALLLRTCASAHKIHGAIYTDSWFGGLAWSACETMLAYVAEKADKPPPLGFFDDGDADASADARRGTKHDFREDWGESYVGRAVPTLFVQRLPSTDALEQPGAPAPLPVDTPAELTAGQPCFAPGDTHLVFVGWDTAPRRLGVTYCYQRPCALYSVAVPVATGVPAAAGGIATLLTPAIRCARAPRFGPARADGTHALAFLASADDSAQTHNNCATLRCMTWPPGPSCRVVVQAVHDEVPGTEFPGLYGDCLPRNPWSADGGHLLLQTMWRSERALLLVHAESGAVRRVEVPGLAPLSNVELLDAAPGVGGSLEVLVSSSTPNCPAQVQLWRVRVADAEVERKVAAPAPRVCPALAALLEGTRCEVMTVDYDVEKLAENGVQPSYEAIVLHAPPSVAEPGVLPPLTVMVHGGPHSAFSTAFSASALLCSLSGSCVVLVNYRGSLGFGRAPLESLLGKCGRQDVGDVNAAVDAVLAKGWADPTRVAVVGGSHGGFLGAHLVAQHPDRYKAAAIRNPVTDIASMVHRTDIPDWCFVEMGMEYDFDSYRAPTCDELVRMREASPMHIASNIRAAVLLLIGESDLRVPPSCGHDFYHVLRANGSPVRMLSYPKDTHAISVPSSEADAWINTVEWIKRYAWTAQ